IPTYEANRQMRCDQMDSTNIGIAGEFYVLAQLAQRGFFDKFYCALSQLPSRYPSWRPLYRSGRRESKVTRRLDDSQPRYSGSIFVMEPVQRCERVVQQGVKIPLTQADENVRSTLERGRIRRREDHEGCSARRVPRECGYAEGMHPQASHRSALDDYRVRVDVCRVTAVIV